MGTRQLRGLTALLLATGALLSACGQTSPTAVRPASAVNAYQALKQQHPRAYRPFPSSLPAETALTARHVSTLNTYDGVSRYLDCATGITADPVSQRLTLDGTVAAPAAWAIWRVPEYKDPAVKPFTQIQVSCYPTTVRYYVAYADYVSGRWQYYDLAQSPTGQVGTIDLQFSHLPHGEACLHSPGGFAYVAVLAVGQSIQVKNIFVTTPEPDPLPGTDAIFDQFEDNDGLVPAPPHAGPYTLAPGTYHASIHQSSAAMVDPNETRDAIDCYAVEVPAGQTLTATLRHEVFDHFGSGLENDADLLFYFPGKSQVYNDFDEPLSSMGIYYDPFEQVLYRNDTGSDATYNLAVVGDIGEPGVRTNCEYDLGISLSANVAQVSGTITQQGAELTKDVVVFLVPDSQGMAGNFNAATPVPGSGASGAFSIQGVPPGTYTLMVHGSARFGPEGYVWPETLPGVTVVAGDVGGLSLDLGPDPA